MTKNQPKSKRPVVDKLAYVLPWPRSILQNTNVSLDDVSRQIKKGIEAEVLKRAYLPGSRYRENIYVKLPSGLKALVQIGALQPDVQKGGIRIEVNPAKFVAGDVERLHKIMKRIIGSEYYDLIKYPLINGCDFAVDVFNLDMNDIVVTYKYAQRYTVFGKRITAAGYIEGYNFGSLSSDHAAAVYGKNIEQVNAALLMLLKNGLGYENLKSNMVQQYLDKKNQKSYIRVEVRGNKMRGLPLYKLSELPNRFERFRFWYFDPAEELNGNLPKYIVDSFMALCRQNGFKAALTTFKNTKWERGIQLFIDSRKADWWLPDLFWTQACNALKKSGLFPEEAFIDPKFRQSESVDICEICK